MVKLQKRFAYKYKEKEHYKHVVTVPEKIVSQLGWSEGDEIQLKVKDAKLVLSAKGLQKGDSE